MMKMTRRAGGGGVGTCWARQHVWQKTSMQTTHHLHLHHHRHRHHHLHYRHHRRLLNPWSKNLRTAWLCQPWEGKLLVANHKLGIKIQGYNTINICIVPIKRHILIWIMAINLEQGINIEIGPTVGNSEPLQLFLMTCDDIVAGPQCRNSYLPRSKVLSKS